MAAMENLASKNLSTKIINELDKRPSIKGQEIAQISLIDPIGCFVS